MKAFLLLMCGGVATFLISLHLFRAALTPPSGDRSRSGQLPHGQAAGSSSQAPAAGSSRRPDRAPGNAKTLRVPPDIVESISISAIDPDGGDFTPEMRELLDLDARELAGAKAIFDGYFKAFTAAELEFATVVSSEERAGDRPGDGELRRFATIRIAPAGDRLANERVAMRTQLVDLLGRPRGLAAAAAIGRQLGNHGTGGEIVAFSKYPGETRYRLEVDGLGDHSLRAGSFRSAPTYERADFSELARYRHLGVLLRK